MIKVNQKNPSVKQSIYLRNGVEIFLFLNNSESEQGGVVCTFRLLMRRVLVSKMANNNSNLLQTPFLDAKEFAASGDSGHDNSIHINRYPYLTEMQFPSYYRAIQTV